MISIHERILLKLIASYKVEIDDQLKQVSLELDDFISNPTRKVKSKPRGMRLSTNQVKYLKLLKKSLSEIVMNNNSSIDSFKAQFDSIIKPSQKTGKSYRQFKDELLKRMGYDDLRSTFYPIFYEKLGPKSCVYCNSQLAVTVNSFGGRKSAKFQVDHFLSKAEYPCFSISFFNLYPVCASCNGKKGKKPVIFKLYSDDYNDLNDTKFSFRIDRRSLVRYRVNGDDSLIKIIYSENALAQFNSTFDIEGIYNTQKDLASEIIIKSMIYNDSYKQMLKHSFSKLYGNDPIKVKRLIVGNYTEKYEIHKRPMSKFTQDIARQLGLI